MSTEIFATLLGLGGAVLIFFLGRWYEKRDKSRRQIIETGVTSTELVNPDKLGPISMSIDKGFVTGKRSESGKLLPVKSAYNYVIGVSNIGLDDLEKPEIDIVLHEKALIVEIKVKSEKISQDKIEIQKDVKRPNFSRIVLHYINRKDSLTISVLSINDSSPKCDISVGGKGIIHRTRSTSAETDTIFGGIPLLPTGWLVIFLLTFVLLNTVFSLLFDVIWPKP